MLLLKKILSFLQHYWWVPLIVFVGVYLFLSGKPLGKIADLLKRTNDLHKAELENIQQELVKKQEAERAAAEKLKETMLAVEKHYQETQQSLDVKKRAEIKEIVAKTKDDPEELARQLQEITGFKVILPKD